MSDTKQPATQNPAPVPAKKTRKPKALKGKKNGKKAANAVPSRLKTPRDQGVYISSSRTKHWLDPNGLNKELEAAINELRDAEPHEVEVKGQPKKTTLFKKLEDLSASTQKLVKLALSQCDTREKAKTVKRDKDVKEAATDPKKAEKLKKEAEELKQKALDKEKKNAERKAAGETVRGPKKVTPYSKEIECLSKMRVRFSKEAAPFVAATICSAMHELMDFGMSKVLGQHRKILKCRHVLQAGVEQLSMSCMYRNLTVFRRRQEAEAKRDAEELKEREEKKKKKAEAAAKAADAKDVKETKADVKADAKDDKEDEDDGEDDDDDEEDEYDERNFRHYIKQVCHNVMNRHIDENEKLPEDKRRPYDQIRVSREVREFGSELVIDFIRMLCPLLQAQIQSKKVKTINEPVVKQVTEMMLTLANVDMKTINATIAQKLKTHDAWVEKKKVEKAEKEKADAAKAEKEKADAAKTAAAPAPPAEKKA